MNAPDRATPAINLPATLQTAKLLAEIAQRSARLGVQQARAGAHAADPPISARSIADEAGG